ncbi:DUF6303 family protein [Streptomyces sp. NBC_00035]|uniref:DUF6303 family protein n=1 Tax=Streptomyces sp. NBC_00035 TaxID=2903614 RepID=UPI003245FB6D
MASVKTPVIKRAGLRRVCCDSGPDRLRGSTNRAHWELYLVVYNTTGQWPHHKWPASRRHQIPTIAERTEALAKLGYAPAQAPAEGWMWQEGETPDYHGHPAAVTVFAAIDIVPLEQPVEGGDI